MGIQVSWYNEEKTIIIWKFIGDWNWQDYHTAINRAVVMLKGVDHMVDSIMDLEHNRALPPDALIEGKRWFVVAPDNFGITVVARANRLIQTIALTIGSVYKQFGSKIMTAPTVEDAVYLILEKQRQRAELVRSK
jgi:hypothetical protein